MLLPNCPPNHEIIAKRKPILMTSQRLAHQIGQHPPQGVRRLKMILVRYRSKNSCTMGIFPSSRRSIGRNEWGIIAVGSEGLLWYIFPAECRVGVFLVELVFSRQKSPSERWEVVKDFRAKHSGMCEKRRDDCENTSLQGGSLLRCRHRIFFIVHASRDSHVVLSHGNVLLVKKRFLVAAPHLFHVNFCFFHIWCGIYCSTSQQCYMFYHTSLYIAL